MVTMKDVAERAGVSVATVSRVINQNGYVSSDVQTRVTAVMRELNYQPSLLRAACVVKRPSPLACSSHS